MGFKITLKEVGVKACALKLAYLTTIQSILKIIELITATVIFSTVIYFKNDGRSVHGDLFFLVIICTFFICMLCLFISEWIIWSVIEAHSKSMFEIVFFVTIVILLLASSINLFTNAVSNYGYDHTIYIAYVTITVLELLLVGLYSVDFILNLCLNCCRKKETKSKDLS